MCAFSQIFVWFGKLLPEIKLEPRLTFSSFWNSFSLFRTPLRIPTILIAKMLSFQGWKRIGVTKSRAFKIENKENWTRRQPIFFPTAPRFDPILTSSIFFPFNRFNRLIGKKKDRIIQIIKAESERKSVNEILESYKICTIFDVAFYFSLTVPLTFSRGFFSEALNLKMSTSIRGIRKLIYSLVDQYFTYSVFFNFTSFSLSMGCFKLVFDFPHP